MNLKKNKKFKAKIIMKLGAASISHKKSPLIIFDVSDEGVITKWIQAIPKPTRNGEMGYFWKSRNFAKVFLSMLSLLLMRSNHVYASVQRDCRKSLFCIRAPGVKLDFSGWMRLEGSRRLGSAYVSAPNTWILPILWTRANNIHCTSTLRLERRVKRSMCLWTQMLAKTGSTIANRRA